MKRTRQAKRAFGAEEKALLVIIAVSSAMILAAFLTKLIPTPSERAEAKLAEIANDYYLMYLYPRLMSEDKDLERAFQKYDELGVATVYLRHLLHYNDNQYEDARGIFEEIGCDVNQTGVRYYPKAPYGPHDYEAKYQWNCEKKVE